MAQRRQQGNTFILNFISFNLEGLLMMIKPSLTGLGRKLFKCIYKKKKTRMFCIFLLDPELLMIFRAKNRISLTMEKSGQNEKKLKSYPSTNSQPN